VEVKRLGAEAKGSELDEEEGGSRALLQTNG
jgi:hypothetical protein